MDNWKTFGHSSVKNILKKHLEVQVFPHAYLFKGPEGVGKKTLALEFASLVLAISQPQSHPDFQLLDVQGEITVESLQNFVRALSFKPFVGQKKVAIINNAQNLNKTSANSLLKTLEEPSQSTILILISSGSVLPTIASRCQVFNFSLFNKSELLEFSNSYSSENQTEAIDLAFGSSSRLDKLFSNKVFFENQKNLKQQFLKLKNSSIGEKILAITDLAEKEPAELREDLLSWMFVQMEELKQKPSEFLKAKALMEAAVSLDQNFNKKMTLQGLMTKI